MKLCVCVCVWFSQVVDARSSGRFAGTEADPRAGLPSGHMVGAINLPFYRLFNPETKTLSSKQAIQAGQCVRACVCLCVCVCVCVCLLARLSSCVYVHCAASAQVADADCFVI